MSRTNKSLCPHDSYQQIDINFGSNECCEGKQNRKWVGNLVGAGLCRWGNPWRALKSRPECEWRVDGITETLGEEHSKQKQMGGFGRGEQVRQDWGLAPLARTEQGRIHFALLESWNIGCLQVWAESVGMSVFLFYFPFTSSPLHYDQLPWTKLT